MYSSNCNLFLWYHHDIPLGSKLHSFDSRVFSLNINYYFVINRYFYSFSFLCNSFFTSSVWTFPFSISQSLVSLTSFMSRNTHWILATIFRTYSTFIMLFLCALIHVHYKLVKIRTKSCSATGSKYFNVLIL